MNARAEKWMHVRPEGLYCAPANCYIDPHDAVDRAIITHGHADHARSGHGDVFATPETLAIMRTRYSDISVKGGVSLNYGQGYDLGNGVTCWLAPAGHILGSAQAVLEYDGQRVVISGDFKRHPDPTCKPFEVVPCDVFITEATFALPVFQHPPLEEEISKLIRSMEVFPERSHLVGVYALGKCQRIMLALRNAGYSHPFYIHGALKKLTELYESFGFDFGEWQPVSEIGVKDRDILRGKIILCPPSALGDRWSRRMPDPLPTMASGWMQIRARVRQRRAEMALIVSDHADWDDLIETALATRAPDVWITHGRVEALQYALEQRGVKAKALNLIGRDEEPE
ncbi:ligase-associated DNA damage response exonuclease [Parasphingorhabdus sp. JC815]|uniref:ligase-associated DNA damage response exonuclease n=1 Tax=Parasphingorhabdus sp. JC815 TaxID=3232140 RepID=UPI003459AF87